MSVSLRFSSLSYQPPRPSRSSSRKRWRSTKKGNRTASRSSLVEPWRRFTSRQSPEYGYYLAGEVAEGDLASFQRTAATLELMYEIRRDFDLIQINGYTFSSFGQPTGLPEGLTLTEYEGDVGMYLVQFKAPMTPTWWRALEATGEVVAYYPQNTYLIRAARGDMPVLRLVNGVQHVSLFQPAYKVRRSLLTRDEVVEVDVEFDGDQDLEVARTALRGILDEDVSDGSHRAVCVLDGCGQLLRIARRSSGGPR